ncbi:MAG: CHASE2 domain-containing protein [Bryobacterales bacterium]|nr:CHASE2 domain-containing protein [Bryobacterales bacterium]
MKPFSVRHPLALIGTAITLAALVLWLMHPAWLTRLDYIAYDAQIRAATPTPLTGNVVIVEIDEASLARYGQWPWPRSVLAGVVNRIRDAGARVIVLDVVFAEPEQRLLEPPDAGARREENHADANGQAGDRFVAASPGDLDLRTSVEPGRVVVGQYFRFDGEGGSKACLLHPVSLSTAFRFDAPEAPYPMANAATCTISEVAGVAAGSGFLNASPDADGTFRRIPLLIGFEDHAYPSLALAAVMSYRNARAAQLLQQQDRSERLRFGDTSVPVGPQTTLLLRFQPDPRAFDRVSAAAIALNPGMLRDKIVLVGGSAAGLRDTLSTPMRSEAPGPDIQATAIDNLLSGSGFERSPSSRTAEVLILLVCGVFCTLLFARFRPIASGLGAALLIAAAWLGTSRYLDATGVFVSPAFAIVLVAVNVGALSVFSLARQRRRAEHSESQAKAARAFMVTMLGNLTMLRDLETGEHLFRMRRYAAILSAALQKYPRFRHVLTDERVALIGELVPMHDMGKVGVTDAILRKPGRLSPAEFEEIKKHVAFGQKVLLDAKSRSTDLDEAIWTVAFHIVSHHHERWDGSGYPEGLKGEEISIEGRIVALIDVYDALVSERVYKTAMSHEEALDILRQSKGTHFDPVVVEAFLREEQAIRRVKDEFHRKPVSLGAPWN